VNEVPVRVDFAGGWLDVPQFALPGGKIVNCAVSPCITRTGPQTIINPYQHGAGIGGSAAWAILNNQPVRQQESAMGAGWQDEAVIHTTGMCSWTAGPEPSLLYRDSGEWLSGLMLLEWTGQEHDTSHLVNHFHDLQLIRHAGEVAHLAHRHQNIETLADAIDLSYCAQIREEMKPLVPRLGALARKYLGSGHGGYALYLYASPEERNKAIGDLSPYFSNRRLIPIEPYCRPAKD
jgi:hypothetical protein